jgi:hypothetical protein
MKIDIVVYVCSQEPRRKRGFALPMIGFRLAALTPLQHNVRVIHPPVEPVRLDSQASLILLLFCSTFADQAYRLADTFGARGKIVVAGGTHATHWPSEALEHCEAVVINEIEPVWANLLVDASTGNLRPQYKENAHCSASFR